jgi:predicted metal-dependent hydrolase
VYCIRFSDRKTLGISVTPGMEVEVTAPKGAAPERVRELVRKKARWIQKQQRFFLTFHPRPAPRQFRSGETHYYLGRQMLLRIKSGKIPGVRYQGRTLEVTALSASEARTLLEKWYRQRAAEKFPEILASVSERFSRYAVKPAGLGLKRMAGRWGSCSGKGRITLHPDLVKAPRGCIEYVITHELCHLVHRNHDSRFWDLQLKMMPDWVKWKNKLEKLLA